MPEPLDLRGSKVDMLSTKHNDMKQRRIVNAAPGVDPNDYVILAQLKQMRDSLQSEIELGKAKGTSRAAPAPLVVTPSSNLTLTTTPTLVPGTSFTISLAGSYLLIGVYYFYFHTGDLGNNLFGGIPVGTQQAVVSATGAAGTSLSATISQVWYLNLPSPPYSMNMTAWKQGGTGSSQLLSANTSLIVIPFG